MSPFYDEAGKGAKGARNSLIMVDVSLRGVPFADNPDFLTVLPTASPWKKHTV